MKHCHRLSSIRLMTPSVAMCIKKFSKCNSIKTVKIIDTRDVPFCTYTIQSNIIIVLLYLITSKWGFCGKYMYHEYSQDIYRNSTDFYTEIFVLKYSNIMNMDDFPVWPWCATFFCFQKILNNFYIPKNLALNHLKSSAP